MNRRREIAAFASSGGPNTVRVTNAVPWDDAGFEALARAVASKSPSATYAVYEVRDGARGLKRVGDVVAVWYFGEGFKHSEGWWVE